MRFLAVLALLAGCSTFDTSFDWVKPGGNYDEERQACDQTAGASGLISPAFLGASKSDECLMSRGWKKVPRS